MDIYTDKQNNNKQEMGKHIKLHIYSFEIVKTNL